MRNIWQRVQGCFGKWIWERSPRKGQDGTNKFPALLREHQQVSAGIFEELQIRLHVSLSLFLPQESRRVFWTWCQVLLARPGSANMQNPFAVSLVIHD